MNTIQFVWQVVRIRKWVFFINLIIFVLFTALSLLSGYVIYALFESLSGPSSYSTGLLIAMIAVLAASRIITNVFSLLTWAIIQFSYLYLLRKNMLEHVLRGKGTRQNGTGDTMNRMRDDAFAIIHYLEYWIDGSAALIYTAASLVILFRIDPWVTTLIFIPLCAVLVVAKQLNHRIEKYYRLSRDSDGKVVNFLEDVLGGARAIKLASAVPSVLSRFEELNKVRQVNGVKNATFISILGSINDNIANLAIGGILLAAAGAMRAGDFSVGEFALFVTYLTQVAQCITKLGWFAAKHKTVQISIERMRQVIGDQPAEALLQTHEPLGAGQQPRAEPLDTLEVRGLSYSYPESKQGIHDINFTVRKGECIVITGKVGAGKTTLIHALLGELPHQEGELLWNGQPVAEPSDFFQPPVAAFTPQLPRLFSSTIRSNIVLGLQKSDAQVQEALHMAVMEEDVDRMDAGLQTLAGPRGIKLSGGQVQRTAAARMLIREVDLYIMDDISSALDRETEMLLLERLLQKRGKTLIIVSNRPAALEKASRIIVMDEGRIAAQDTLEQLLQSNRYVQDLYEQAGAKPMNAEGEGSS